MHWGLWRNCDCARRVFIVLLQFQCACSSCVVQVRWRPSLLRESSCMQSRWRRSPLHRAMGHAIVMRCALAWPRNCDGAYRFYMGPFLGSATATAARAGHEIAKAPTASAWGLGLGLRPGGTPAPRGPPSLTPILSKPGQILTESVFRPKIDFNKTRADFGKIRVPPENRFYQKPHRF